MALMTKKGYGQVEFNHVAAQKTGQIFAQFPLDKNIEVLENGAFMKYDYATGEVNTTGEGEWMLVYNEIKNYSSSVVGDKSFAMKKADALRGEVVPRLYMINNNDTFTTNLVNHTTAFASLVGKYLTPVVDATKKVGILTETALGDIEAGNPAFVVVKAYTMPDGQLGVKVAKVKTV